MQNESKWLVVLNPNAANGKAKRKQSLVEHELHNAKIDFELVVSKSRSDAFEIIHTAIESGFRKFISVGGDGSLNCLVNGIFSQQKISPSKIIIAVIPIGTGNDWIKTHLIPKSISKAIAIVKKEKTMLHDVGRVRKKNESGFEERYFINEAGCAFQAFVVERIDSKSKWLKVGMAAFILGLLDALFRYKSTEVQIDLEEEHIQEKIFNVSIGICNFAGGGMKLTPNAIADDGLLDVTIVKEISKLQVLRNVFRLFNGKFVRNKKVLQLRSKKSWVASTPIAPVETDGETFGYGNVEIEIFEKAISVITNMNR